MDYFRRDQSKGISPPDLTKDCTYAEHIVRARGKRTRYTSVSLAADAIRGFGPTLYKLLCDQLAEGGHGLVEHAALLDALRQVATEETRADRARAIVALRYARRRKEGLVVWRFDISGVARKEIINWAAERVRPFFARV